MRPILPTMLLVPVLAGLVLPVAPGSAWRAVAGARPATTAPPASASASASAPASASAAAPAMWVWPTGSPVVERPWEAPAGDHGPGHRGIDVAASIGSEAVAVADGTVAFAGQVAGRSVVTIDHGDGLVSTLDSVAPLVRAGTGVEQGEPVGTVAVGHCAASAPCLHLGARRDDRYVDPTAFLPRAAWPVLLPEDAWTG